MSWNLIKIWNVQGKYFSREKIEILPKKWKPIWKIKKLQSKNLVDNN